MADSAVAPLTAPWPASAGVFTSPPRLMKNGKPGRPSLHVDYGACASCGRAVYEVAGCAPRHADNHEFRCPDPFVGTGWAVMLDVEAVETRLEDALDEQSRDHDDALDAAVDAASTESYDDGRDEGLDEGEQTGRKDMHAEIDEALTGVDLTGLGLTAEQVTSVYAALADAWNHIVP